MGEDRFRDAHDMRAAGKPLEGAQRCSLLLHGPLDPDAVKSIEVNIWPESKSSVFMELLTLWLDSRSMSRLKCSRLPTANDRNPTTFGIGG
jgi:hypothetical protein